MAGAPDTAPEYSKGLRALASSYRTRLFVAIILVVAVVLGLVLISLPRLLEGFFLTQEQSNLESRAQITAGLLADELAGLSADGQPLLLADEPWYSTQLVLGPEAGGLVSELTEGVADADVRVSLAPAIGAAVVLESSVALPDDAPLLGILGDVVGALENAIGTADALVIEMADDAGIIVLFVGAHRAAVHALG